MNELDTVDLKVTINELPLFYFIDTRHFGTDTLWIYIMRNETSPDIGSLMPYVWVEINCFPTNLKIEWDKLFTRKKLLIH